MYLESVQRVKLRSHLRRKAVRKLGGDKERDEEETIARSLRYEYFNILGTQLYW